MMFGVRPAFPARVPPKTGDAPLAGRPDGGPGEADPVGEVFLVVGAEFSQDHRHAPIDESFLQPVEPARELVIVAAGAPVLAGFRPGYLFLLPGEIHRAVVVHLHDQPAGDGVLRERESVQHVLMIGRAVGVDQEKTPGVLAARGAHRVHEQLIQAIDDGHGARVASVPGALAVQDFVETLEEQAAVDTGETCGDGAPYSGELLLALGQPRGTGLEPGGRVGAGVVMDIDDAVQPRVQGHGDQRLDPVQPGGVYTAVLRHMGAPGHRNAHGAETGRAHRLEYPLGRDGISPGGFVGFRAAVGMFLYPAVRVTAPGIGIKRVPQVPADAKSPDQLRPGRVRTGDRRGRPDVRGRRRRLGHRCAHGRTGNEQGDEKAGGGGPALKMT